VAGELVLVTVTDVRVAVPAAAGVEAGLVVLSVVAEPRRSVRIIIGQPEARAIQAAWTGTSPTRPSTWDLFVSTIALLGGQLSRSVITSVEDRRHFFAQIELDHAGQRHVLACRPSDAIALALRAYGAELFVADEVLVATGAAEDGAPTVPPDGPWPSGA
jgi:bifunctional DNase/RNase